MNSRTEESAERPKEAVFIYSTPLFVLVFDGNFKLLQKIKASEEAIASLMKGEWLPEEKAAAKKAVAEEKSVVVLGYRNEKIEGVAFSQDVKKLELASSAAAAGGNYGKLRQLLINFTKKAVAESVSDDNLIIQASSAIGEINKAISLLIKRVREWYELYCPEFSAATPDHEEFITEVLGSSKAELLKKLKIAEKDTMGADLAKGDVDRILAFAATVNGLYDSRDLLVEYLESVMKSHCPNMAAVAGASTGAGLIAQAGSLARLAMLPSSTIQLLGAERELFKHLKDKRQRPPKAGILQGHPLVTSAPRQQQGRIAKLLADKISIAVRVDYFKGKFVGDSLLSDLKKRLQQRAAESAAPAGRQK